jgi:hypothetical protein
MIHPSLTNRHRQVQLLSLLTTLLLCTLSLLPNALAEDAAPVSKSQQPFDHTHQIFDEVLNQLVVVTSTKSAVNYTALQSNPTPLNSYLKNISSVTNEDYKSFSEEQQLAFLINAYNGFTLQWILKHYPTSSIKKTVGLLSNPWKQEFFILFGEERNLDYIEHERIRKDFKEPRIHFALVCAAKSCPPLRNEAYIPSRLDEQLSAAAQNFLGDPDRNYYDQKNSRLYLSKIFDWFSGDFTATGKSIPEYVVPLMKGVPVGVASADTKVSFLDYDWSLNDYKPN